MMLDGEGEGGGEGATRRGSLTDLVVDSIRRMVTEGTLRSGDRVNELELANGLGISRGPVREAVRRLSSSGLLVEAPNVGARVISPSPEHIREFYLVRELLESQAACEAALHMTEAERQSLLDVLEHHTAKLADDPDADYPQSQDDWDFHMLVLEGSHNSLITRICGNDLRDVFLLLRARYGRRRRRGPQALEEHRAIAQAVVAGNPEVAQILMRQHIRASHQVFLTMMQEPVA